MKELTEFELLVYTRYKRRKTVEKTAQELKLPIETIEHTLEDIKAKLGNEYERF